MGAMIHFGTDGWRARLDGDFTEDNVVRIADAAAHLWARDAAGAIVLIGYDTRPGAEHFARIAARVIASHGLIARISDRHAPTPALSWAVSQDVRVVGGFMITGSHHPYDYLGIKLRVADGGVGTADFYEELEAAIDYEPTQERGPIEVTDYLTPYLDNLVMSVNGEAIAGAGLKVVYDPLYGAARGHVADMLRVLGVDVVELHGADDDETDGVHPEPIEPWVDDCEQAVVKLGACAGLLNDGDGDRVGAVDERGRFVSAHKIIALVLGHLCVNRGMSGRVVLNVTASALTKRVVEALGLRMTLKPVGYNYIYAEMRKGDVLLGGEEAGGIGIYAHMPERDGLLMVLLLCELMAMSGKSLGELVDELESRFGHLHSARRDVRMGPEVIEMLRTVLPGLNPPEVAGQKPVAVSHKDGLRLEFEDDSWLLLRPSGTEPVVRVYAEASTIERRDELMDAGIDIARGGIS